MVDHDPETVSFGRVEQIDEPGHATELGTHPPMVDDVVPVGAARHRLGDGREVKVAHPEFGEVVEQVGDRSEPELRGELESVGRDPIEP
jgi:hypothetical protein